MLQRFLYKEWMKILVIANATESLNAASDTALGFAREALSRGHQVSWATSQDLRLWNNQVEVRHQILQNCAEAELPSLAEAELAPVNQFQSIWIRKDPPFDMEYLSLCWLLGLEENSISILNPPSVLARFHEKMIPFEAVRQGFLNSEDVVPTFLSTAEEDSVPGDFPIGSCISKPWFGHGGRDVEQWTNATEAFATPFGPSHGYTLFQPFLPAVTQSGDRRVLFIHGEYAGDVVRIPQSGSIKANLVQGARGELQDLNATEEALVKKLSGFLKQHNIYFAGADFIDGHITEVNITAPTGVETIRALGGPDLRKPYLDMVEALARD